MSTAAESLGCFNFHLEVRNYCDWFRFSSCLFEGKTSRTLILSLLDLIIWAFPGQHIAFIIGQSHVSGRAENLIKLFIISGSIITDSPAILKITIWIIILLIAFLTRCLVHRQRICTLLSRVIFSTPCAKFVFPSLGSLSKSWRRRQRESWPSKRFCDKSNTVHVRYNSFTFFCCPRNWQQRGMNKHCRCPRSSNDDGEFFVFPFENERFHCIFILSTCFRARGVLNRSRQLWIPLVKHKIHFYYLASSSAWPSSVVA